MGGRKKTGGVAWHPAFFDAIRAELAAYRDALEFRSEHQLNAEPLRIDVLIINFTRCWKRIWWRQARGLKC